MKLIKYTDKVQKTLHEKGINVQTQNYIIKYLYINQKLFGRTLDIDKIVDRILNNLNHSITYIGNNTPIVEMKEILFTLLHSGAWYGYEHKIRINPILKMESRLFKTKKRKMDSIIMHEIDHCATTEYEKISESEKEKCVDSYIEKYGISNSKLEDIIRNNANNIYNKRHGKLSICGISNNYYAMLRGVDLKNLNEGITAYKQELYDKFLGNKPINNYRAEKIVAKFIGSVIGEDELIKLHFENNYEGIRKNFYERTGKELNELIIRLNQKSKFKEMLFGNLYTRRFSRKMKKFINEFERNMPQQKEVSRDGVKSFRDRLSMDVPSLQEQAVNNKNIQNRLKKKSMDKKPIDKEHI